MNNKNPESSQIRKKILFNALGRTKNRYRERGKGGGFLKSHVQEFEAEEKT